MEKLTLKQSQLWVKVAAVGWRYQRHLDPTQWRVYRLRHTHFQLSLQKVSKKGPKSTPKRSPKGAHIWAPISLILASKWQQGNGSDKGIWLQEHARAYPFWVHSNPYSLKLVKGEGQMLHMTFAKVGGDPRSPQRS